MVIVTVMLLAIFSLIYHATGLQMESESVQTLQILSQNSQQNVRLPHFTLELTPQGTVRASGNTYYDLSDEDRLYLVIHLVRLEKAIH